MLRKDDGSLFFVAALLAVAAAVQMEPGRVRSTVEKQALAVNSSARRKAQLGLGPASVAGTWSVNYNPGWPSTQYSSLAIDCFGRMTIWNDWQGPMFFGAAQISAKCLYGDQAQAGGIEYLIPGWNDAAKYECGWLDSANDILYAYHYSANTGGGTSYGHSNVGFYGRQKGTRTGTTACPAGLTMFLYAPHWEVVDTYGFKPDGVDPISGTSWNLSPLSTPVTTHSGTQVFDFNSDSGYLETDETTSWTLGNHFTECVWVYWRAMDVDGWRTIFRPHEDHVILVKSPSGELGLYKNIDPPQHFHGTGYVVNTNDWNFVCVVVDADAPSSSFYVSVAGSGLAHVGTVNQFVGSGKSAWRFGYPTQGPGYIHMFAHWEVELSESEMWAVMADTNPPTVTVSSASPTVSPTVSPTMSPTASPTTAVPTSSPTASPTTAAPTASPTASPTTAAPTASPTASPTTAAPTASPTESPTTVAAPAVVGAVGDPHMSDVRGRTFDMNAVGTITVLLVPKGADLNSTLLRVEARTKRAGVCGSLYIQNLLVQGKWVQREGGYNISATSNKWAEPMSPHHKWRASVGPGVRLTVGYGRTESGILYLNFHASGLGNAHMPIGGLLGDEDNEAYAWAKEKPRECLSLSASAVAAPATGAAAGSEGSTASASL